MPIISAVVVLSALSNQNVGGIIMRSQPKTHGTKQSLEGDVAPGMRVVVVDDTCTTGASLLSTIDALQASGCVVVSCVLYVSPCKILLQFASLIRYSLKEVSRRAG